MYHHSQNQTDEEVTHRTHRRVLSFAPPPTLVKTLGCDIGKPKYQRTDSGWNRRPV